ncbi:MAG: GH3 auxin-responsive promoter family protein, partial [Rhodothermales bacterium]|nr:GH3 auxin-responsive promoter family protein [Rhodothermales bacterium]
MSNLPSMLARHIPFGPTRKFQRSALEPAAVQVRLLRRLLKRAHSTAYGRDLGLASVDLRGGLIESFQKTVPLQTYDDLRDRVERARKGERDVMWPGRIRDFAVSSGTASAGKIIPLSRETLKANSRFSLAAALNHFEHTGDVSMWLGKMLSLPGRIEEDPSYPGTLVGEVSGFQSKYAPAFVRSL